MPRGKKTVANISALVLSHFFPVSRLCMVQCESLYRLFSPFIATITSLDYVTMKVDIEDEVRLQGFSDKIDMSNSKAIF